MAVSWAGYGLVALLVSWARMSLLRSPRRRRERESATTELRVSPLSGLVIGAMFLGFQAIVQPKVRHMVVEEQKDDASDGDDWERFLGGAEYHRQLRMIRSGRDAGRLEVQGAKQSGWMKGRK
jgi:hypothetical protein